MNDPDASAAAFLDQPPEPLRYDLQQPDPWESTGVILSMIPDGARVLDVGCGTGSISALIKEIRHANVVGIEPHEHRALKARSRGVEVVVAEFTPETAAQLGLFDVVLFADVLEHLADPLKTLQLAGTSLNPGGSVVASVPNIAHWTVRWNLLRGRFNYEELGIMDATHLRWFTAKTIEQTFRRAGFRVIDMKVSAGLWMNQYTRAPWRWLPPGLRNAVIRRAAAWFPTLAGCQYVLEGVLSPSA
jgi:methionine biosynthesis protein MetW